MIELCLDGNVCAIGSTERVGYGCGTGGKLVSWVVGWLFHSMIYIQKKNPLFHSFFYF